MLNDATETEERQQYVTFASAGRSYGVDIIRVREIRQWAPTTELPGEPSYGRGVLNIRGDVIPVHDLNARLGGGLTDVTDDHVVVIVTVDGQNIGVLVDAVSDIIDVKADDIRPVPSGAQSGGADVVAGLVKHQDQMTALLDLARLFPKDVEDAA